MSHGKEHYERLILDYFLAVDEERIDDVLSFFHHDATVRFAFHAEPVHGQEALRAFYAAHVARFAEHVDRVTRVIVDGDLGISELVFDAVTVDGRPVHLENCNVYRFRDGLFHEVHVYLDTVTMARQLGTAPDPTG